MWNADAVASFLVGCLGPFDWAVLWAYRLPWGDRSLEDVPSLDWRRYAAWRLRQGEQRGLYDAPGHAFEAGEQDKLVEVVRSAIYMGWDARAFCQPRRFRFDLSHDDVITIRSHDNIKGACKTMTQLGLRLAGPSWNLVP